MHPSYSPVTWINYSFLASRIMSDLGRAFCFSSSCKEVPLFSPVQCVWRLESYLYSDRREGRSEHGFGMPHDSFLWGHDHEWFSLGFCLKHYLACCHPWLLGLWTHRPPLMYLTLGASFQILELGMLFPIVGLWCLLFPLWIALRSTVHSLGVFDYQLADARGVVGSRDWKPEVYL